MSSKRDKDFHKLRNSEKYFGKFEKYGWGGKDRIVGLPITSEEAEAQDAYNKLHEKYGYKSMVSNKRRRNTTRKSNQRNKQMAHAQTRSREKSELIKLIVDEEYSTDMKS